MIAKFTNSPIGALIFNLIVVGLFVLKIYSVVIQGVITPSIYQLIEFDYQLNESLIATIIAFCYVTSVLLVLRINSKHRFIEFSNSPFLLFLIVGFTLFPINTLSLNIALSLSINLLVLRVLLDIYNQPSVNVQIVVTAVLVGISTIIFYPSAIFLLLVFIAIAILRPFHLRNFILLLVGFLLPLFYLFIFGYLTNGQLEINELDYGSRSLASFQLTKGHVLFLSFLPLVVFSGIKLFTSQVKFIVRQRNQLTILYFFLLITSILVYKIELSNLVFFLLLPTALFFNYWYKEFTKKWALDLFLVLLIISSLFIK